MTAESESDDRSSNVSDQIETSLIDDTYQGKYAMQKEYNLNVIIERASGRKRYVTNMSLREI